MPIRITRVYTRTGDKGDTALVGGKRVPKDSLRIEAYGTVDELNSIVGLARACNHEAPAGAARDRLEGILKRLQNELFDLGSELATPPEAGYEGMFRVGDEQVKALEDLMDECEKDLEPLKSFILPGGGRVSAFLHQCRTVCRRAERIVVQLGREEDIGPGPLRYLNRLSDLFFVLSRWIGKQNGEREFLWERGLQSHERAKSKSPSPSGGVDQQVETPSVSSPSRRGRG
jgi:cob(I)alamin adenosyltransferase